MNDPRTAAELLQERLVRLKSDADALSADIQVAYPNADAIFDAIDLAGADLNDALNLFNDFDPDDSFQDDDDPDDDPDDDEPSF
jgi:hypothetical protein